MAKNAFARWKQLLYLPMFTKLALYHDIEARDAVDKAAVFLVGNGAPTAIAANGSVYLRLDGGLATSLYLRISGAWVAVTGVAGAAASFASAAISGALTVGTTLGVTGAATFGSTVGITGAATVGGTLGVTGATTVTSITATGNATLGNSATADAHSITGTLALNGLVTNAIQTITVADNTTIIASGSPGANQALLSQNLIAANNTSGVSKNLTLPAASEWSGKILFIANVSANDVVVKDSGGTTLATLTAGLAVMVVSNGTGVAKLVS